MITLSIDTLAKLVDARVLGTPSAAVSSICTDSRHAVPGALFVALPGARVDGHRFVAEALQHGAAAALVRRSAIAQSASGVLLEVEDPLVALQRLAAWYRRAHLKRVVGITGSNGKTAVKDALAAMVSGFWTVASSPGSYNSQLGVALSILRAPPGVELAIIETGVSGPGQMDSLARMVRPDAGIFTNLGQAHLCNFASLEATAAEKSRLFRSMDSNAVVLVGQDHAIVKNALGNLPCQVQTVFDANGERPGISLRRTSSHSFAAVIDLDGEHAVVALQTPSLTQARNIVVALIAARALGVPFAHAVRGAEGFCSADNRLEVWRLPSGISVLDDASSCDPISVVAAVRTASEIAQNHAKKIMLFGGMVENGVAEHAAVGALLRDHGFSDVVLMAEALRYHNALAQAFLGPTHEASSEAQALSILRRLIKDHDVVLIKGPRHHQLSNVAHHLAEAMAQRTLTVDLAAVSENIAQFKRLCGGKTKVMGMLKALGYGTGAQAMGGWLAQSGLDAIGVSATDEGIALRRAGVTCEIYVLMAAPEDARTLAAFNLIPIVSNRRMAQAFVRDMHGCDTHLAVHLEIDTGMHRVGVQPHEVLDIARQLQQCESISLTGVMTHFASGESPEHDAMTQRQRDIFETCCKSLSDAGFSGLVRHACNTASTVRHASCRYDMVRIGIGLYGIYPSAAVEEALPLRLAVSLRSRIESIAELEAGESVGYGATYTTTGKTRVAVVPLGYSDGVPWRLANRGHMLVDGVLAPIIGRVSMDTSVVDITHIPQASIGSEVLVYGVSGTQSLRPEAIAQEAGTIAYELLTSIGDRVVRIFLPA